MNVLIVGDLHFGKRHRLYPARDLDVVEAILTWSSSLNKSGWVIIAGDLFDSSRPSPNVTALAMDMIANLLSSGLRVVIIAGNHDLGHNVSAIEPFTSSLVKSGLAVYSQSPSDQYPFWLSDWDSFIPPQDTRLAIAHGTHTNSPIAPPDAAISPSERIPAPWGLPGGVTVLGHLHHGHEFTVSDHRFIYTGPPVQTAFGEGRPGYVLADISNDGEVLAIEWRESDIGKRFMDYSDWDGRTPAIIKAVAQNEEEAEKLRFYFDSLTLNNDIIGEVVVKPESSISELGKSVAGSFEVGGPVEAYVAYVKAKGRKPAPEVLKMLRSI